MPPKPPPPPLIDGPYAAPRCIVGRPLACRVRGAVPVDGLTDAPVPWPYTRHRGAGVTRSPRPILILCGDLERAVRVESVTAICHHWGVSHKVVTRWRQALGVGKMTEGTVRAFGRGRQFGNLTALTPKNVATVRRALAQGKTAREIEDATGVSRRAVWRIARGDTFVEE